MLQIAGMPTTLSLLSVLLSVLLLLMLSAGGWAEISRHRLTIFAEAGRMECYHQAVAATEHIIVEYQVIYGGQGESHINCNLMDPARRLLFTDHKQGQGKYQLVANETGVYKLCFDNTISSFNQKIVVFTLQILPDNHEELERQKTIKEMNTDYQFDRTYSHINDYMTKITVNLMRSRQSQDYIRTLEAKDRKVAESNFTLVNNWSCAQFIAMIVVGMLQVFMLRSIFNTDGRFYKFWKKI
ncbi:hypothetical protein KR093_003082 [Drosophila rubida]|uniref:GOLD domain-containing protein n=1 Tax=Drosophila rubida TaxID=30044 RepID=A0AAD4K6L5_9MUSC|nr:hypothetical protein KR093_003082 [Drosophila rubida]